MKTLLFIFLTLLSTLCTLGIYPAKEKNTLIKSENREVKYFDEIHVFSAIQVILQQGNTRAIKVEAEADVLPFLTTDIHDHKLVISISSMHDKKNIRQPMKVYVTTPEIKEIEVSQASSVTSDAIWAASKLELEASSAAKIRLTVKTDILDIDVSSAANIRLKGETQQLEAEVSSASNLNAQELIAQKADIEISGAAQASVNVVKEIKYEISGAANLNYKGNPQILKAEVDRSSKVSH